MSEHIFDELPRLLTGQSTRDELRTSVAHLRTCVDCQQELIDALAAHASLSSAARYTPSAHVRRLVRSADGEPDNDAADADNVIGAQFGLTTDVPQQARVEADSTPSPTGPASGDGVPISSRSGDLPDLSALFSAVRSEAAGADGLEDYRISYSDLDDGFQSESPTAASSPVVTSASTSADDGLDSLAGRRHRLRARRGFSGRWLVAAAAVGLGIGSAAVLAGQHRGTPTTTNVALAAYDAGSVPATAKLVGSDDMKLDASALPKPASGSLYEVWLTNASRTKMHALGWIDSSGKGEFTLPTQLLDEYTAIEVSVQKLNSSYDYSGTSVLRGTY